MWHFLSFKTSFCASDSAETNFSINTEILCDWSTLKYIFIKKNTLSIDFDGSNFVLSDFRENSNNKGLRINERFWHFEKGE